VLHRGAVTLLQGISEVEKAAGGAKEQRLGQQQTLITVFSLSCCSACTLLSAML
jgi:hypothetical protein